MNEVIAINNRTQVNQFKMNWNIGIRCNYDCSYCPSFRHSTTQPHNSLDDLKKTVKFIKQYIQRHKTLTDNSFDEYLITLSGGEPLSNPNIVELMTYMKNEIPFLDITMTSNGTGGIQLWDKIYPNTSSVTISYHAEAEFTIKNKVVETIKYLHDKSLLGINDFHRVSVNVMLHEDPELFEDCQNVIADLKAYGVMVNPRTIDRDQSQADNRKKVFKNNQMGPRPVQKEYNKTQLTNINEVFKISKSKVIETKEQVKSVNARPCCSRDLLTTATNSIAASDDNNLHNDAVWTDTPVISDRYFKGWYCAVNIQWLDIEQDEGAIYYHQTCKARLDNTRGPICTIEDSDTLLASMDEWIASNTIPVMTCPKDGLCSCGICIPKSSDKGVYKTLFRQMSKNIQLKFK